MEQELLTAYVALLALATVPIYIGSFKSLNPSSDIEKISSKDAYWFPVIASGALFGLYIVFKFLAKDLVNLLLTSYYLLLGVGAVSNVLAPVFKVIVPYFNIKKLMEIKIPIPFKDPIHLKFDYYDVMGAVVGFAIAVFYFITKNWIANNIFGEAFSILSIELINLGSFKVGCVMLWGLFFYDIFWVFGTDVMETVAKSFEGPIKVLWPRGGDKFSLLGLGDIVIPGFFISMMLRFDAHLAKKHGTHNKKIYFHVCFVSYIISLICTVTVLHIFKKGQPALLYIVPLIVGSVLITSMIRGEFSELFGFEEHPEVAEIDSKPTVTPTVTPVSTPANTRVTRSMGKTPLPAVVPKADKKTK